MAKADKATAVADIAEQFKEATATVVTEYRGLTVANLAELRARSPAPPPTPSPRTRWSSGPRRSRYRGPRRTVRRTHRIAFIKGEPVDAAKAIKTFAKDNKALIIKGGYMDGHALSVAEVERIADLESREVLLAKLAGAMKGKLAKAAGCSTLRRRRSPDWPPLCKRRKAGEEVPPSKPPDTRDHPHPNHYERKDHTPWRSSAPTNCSTLQGDDPAGALRVREDVRRDLRRHRRRAGRRCRRRRRGAAAPAEAAEEQSEFDVILEGAGEKKIGVIKVVREIVSGLGLKEAKDLVDGAPKPVLEKVNKEAADDAKAKLEEAGASVTVK